MSVLILKRVAGECVVIGGSTRLTVRGVDAESVTLCLQHARPDGSVSAIRFNLDRGRPVPVGSGTTLELQRTLDKRCWLMFEGPPRVVYRGELVTEGPWAKRGTAEAVAGGAL